MRQAGATLHRGARASHYRGLSCCGAQAPDAQAQQLWPTGLAAPWHVGSSQTRARTRVPCISRQILNHCATREAPPGISEGPLGAGTVLGVGLFGGRDEKSQCFHRELECARGPGHQQTQINRHITKTGSYMTTKAVVGHREVRELLLWISPAWQASLRSSHGGPRR